MRGTGGTEEDADDGSTWTSIEAMPRTAPPGLPPHTTTERVAFPAAACDRSPRSWKSRLFWAGSNTWKSFSDSPTNNSTRPRPRGADALPRTVMTPATVAAAAGWLMLTVAASASVVGQVLGMAPTGGAGAAIHPATATRAATSEPPRPRAASGET